MISAVDSEFRFKRASQYRINRQYSNEESSLIRTFAAGSGFGANNTTTTPFGGNRPGFGTNTTTTGAMFGSNTATAGASTGFGGFGATNNNSNASGSLFGGANKPAFGTGNASGGSLFGGGSGGNAFGTSNNQPTSVFGAPLSSALGANTAESQGTGSTPFQHYTEKESGTNVANHFQSISFMQPYKNYSFEVHNYCMAYLAQPLTLHRN